LDDFKAASDMIPKIIDYASVFSNIGVIYTDFGQYQLAIDNFNEAIRLDPYAKDALNNRAYAHFKNNNKVSACTDAKKACELGNCRIFQLLGTKGFCR
jgi:tetratricopeptide (TPR) repeat protein